MRSLLEEMLLLLPPEIVFTPSAGTSGCPKSSFGQLENATESLALGWLLGARDPAVRLDSDQFKALRLDKGTDGALLSTRPCPFDACSSVETRT